MDIKVQGSDVEEQAQRLLQGAKDFALEKVVPASMDRARELAERLQTRRYLEQVQELERDFTKRTKRLERKLEKKAKRLPVDTPLDKRRRSRARRRGASGTLVIVGLGGAAAYVVWRGQRDRGQLSPAEPPSERHAERAADLGAPASGGDTAPRPNQHASAARKHTS